MENKVSKAIEDINNIKNIIEESKVYHRGLAKLSVVYGIYCLLDGILSLYSIYSTKNLYIMLMLKVSILILFLFVFLQIYKAEKKCTNKYYLSLYGIWAILGIVFPIMKIISNVFCSVFRIEAVSNLVELPINVILFSVFLLVCAYMTGNKKLFPVSVAILFVYIMLSTIWWDHGINISIPMSNNAVLSYSYIYNLLFVCCGYIVMGLYILKRGRYDDK